MAFEDDDRRSAAERLAAYAVVGLLVGLLVVMGHTIRTANERVSVSAARVVELEHQLALSDELVTQLTTEHDLLMQQRYKLLTEIDRLTAITPTERIIVQACPEPTPAFSRDSQFTAK